MAKKIIESELLTAKDIYEEIGRNYRFFLNWRYGIIAGYLAMLGTLASVFWGFDPNASRYYWIAFILAAVFTGFFWLLELRNRELYRNCTNCGEVLEKEFFIKRASGIDGIYMRLNRGREEQKRRYSHSKTIDAFFIFFLFIFLMLAMVFFTSG